MNSESTLVIGHIWSPVLARGPADAREAVVFVHGNPGPKEDWASRPQPHKPRTLGTGPGSSTGRCRRETGDVGC